MHTYQLVFFELILSQMAASLHSQLDRIYNVSEDTRGKEKKRKERRKKKERPETRRGKGRDGETEE